MGRTNCSAFFANRECEYFPCHKGADPENFNCLFCYCPLYALGEECSNCLFPHNPDNYMAICMRYEEVAELAKKKP